MQEVETTHKNRNFFFLKVAIAESTDPDINLIQTEGIESKELESDGEVEMEEVEHEPDESIVISDSEEELSDDETEPQATRLKKVELCYHTILREEILNFSLIFRIPKL